MRVLGIDLGTKTIGLALSDETRLVATPLATMPRQGNNRDVFALSELAKKHEVRTMVIGLPIALDGSIGTQAKRSLVFAEALRKAGFEVETWDERFSTVAAERVLLEADLSRARRKQVIDKVAAAYILQGWLDAQRASAERDSEPE